ncbi:MAG: diguanylate cyclase [bacterium]
MSDSAKIPLERGLRSKFISLEVEELTMDQVSCQVEAPNDVKTFLKEENIPEFHRENEDTLVSVFTHRVDKDYISDLSSAVRDLVPGARTLVATTAGEILKGDTVTNQTVMTVTSFESTSVVPVPVSCEPGEENRAGERLRRELDSISPSAVFLFSTPMRINVNRLIRSMTEEPYNYDIVGGGAGNYAMNGSLLGCGDSIVDSGVVAVGLVGDEIELKKETFVGWNSMSKKMTVTEVDGQSVVSINDEPAVNIYRNYLDIGDGEEFFSNALGFPMLSEREDDMLARVPHDVGDNGELKFITDFDEGEEFQIGFVEPRTIQTRLMEIVDEFKSFEAESIFLFTCGCRRFALLDDVELETSVFSEIAPVSGFYTVGEYCSNGKSLVQRNLTFTAVALREGAEVHSDNGGAEDSFDAPLNFENGESQSNDDLFFGSHTEVIDRLLYFIDTLNEELQEKNRALEKRAEQLKEKNEELYEISRTDSLTDLYNRKELDNVLRQEMKRYRRTGTPFGVILMDMDHFKQLNDTFGHQVGDGVLKEFAGLLRSRVRETDTAGRWGGEEFLLVAPDTDLEGVRELTETARKLVDNHDFPVERDVTISVGSTVSAPGDTIEDMVARADQALYEAKDNGRNLVEVNPPSKKSHEFVDE